MDAKYLNGEKAGGLSLVLSLIEQIDGKLTYENKEGNKFLITFRLRNSWPLYNSELPANHPGVRARRTQPGGSPRRNRFAFLRSGSKCSPPWPRAFE